MPTAAQIEAKLIAKLPKIWAAAGRECNKVVAVGSSQDFAAGTVTDGTPTDVPVTATQVFGYETSRGVRPVEGSSGYVLVKPNAAVTWTTDDRFKDDEGDVWIVIKAEKIRHLTTHAWVLHLKGAA